MSTASFTKDYSHIKDEIKLYKKYLAIWIFIFVIEFIFFVIILFLTGEWISRNEEGIPIFIAFCAIIFFLTLGFSTEKISPYRVSREKRVFIDAYKTLENLEKYFDTELEPLKKKARKTAYYDFQEVIYKVNQWSVGNVNLTKENLGNDMNHFQICLENNILKNIKRGDEEILRQIIRLIPSFMNYLLNPKPDFKDFHHLINLVSIIEPPLVRKVTLWTKFLDLLERYSIIKFTKLIISIFGVFIFGFITFIFGTRYLDISTGDSYIASITIVGFLLAALISKYRYGLKKD